MVYSCRMFLYDKKQLLVHTLHSISKNTWLHNYIFSLYFFFSISLLTNSGEHQLNLFCSTGKTVRYEYMTISMHTLKHKTPQNYKIISLNNMTAQRGL